MTWIKFIIWLCGLYVAYYFLIILWDMLKRRPSSAHPGANELTFAEHIEPVAALPEVTEPEMGDPVVSSGGVSLKQIFNLAREEAIEYIRPVSFA